MDHPNVSILKKKELKIPYMFCNKFLFLLEDRRFNNNKKKINLHKTQTLLLR
jgi:hypothetical protein